MNELPMIDPSVREAGQEVSDGVRTVTRNARRAFDFFARELPMPEIGEQNELIHVFTFSARMAPCES